MRRDLIGVSSSLGAAMGSIFFHFNEIMQGLSLTLGVVLAGWALADRIRQYRENHKPKA